MQRCAAFKFVIFSEKLLSVDAFAVLLCLNIIFLLVDMHSHCHQFVISLFFFFSVKIVICRLMKVVEKTKVVHS